MPNDTSRKTEKQSPFNVGIPPTYSNAYKVNISDENLIHISFAWFPPEAKVEVHVLYRLVFAPSSARDLANDILKTVEQVEKDRKK